MEQPIADGYVNYYFVLGSLLRSTMPSAAMLSPCLLDGWGHRSGEYCGTYLAPLDCGLRGL
jgi:hypothetical protein